MANFSKLKNKKRNVDALAAKADEMKGGFKKDERIWKPQRDEAGNAYAVIRFLDLSPIDMEIQEKIAEAEGEDVAEKKVTPWVLKYGHSFRGPGGWYIEDSRTTLGQDESDPVAELNKSEWDENDEEAKKKVRPRSRKKKYYSNVLIIKDSNNPENNGKVMLYEYGQKIFDKINECLKPKFPDDPKFDPFSFYDGADFILKVYTEEKGRNKFPNYDKSEFAARSPLFGGDDDKIEAVWKKSYSLQDLISPDKFKSYEELKKRLEMALKRSVGGNSNVGEDAEEETRRSEPEPEQKSSDPFEDDVQDTPEPSKSESSDIDDDDLDFFENLGK